ncbi:MAG: rod shape-determining protein MreD [Chloroflexi bacterium]|nr:rod shape-determining protein MreD [Chloroflexota bacterium]
MSLLVGIPLLLFEAIAQSAILAHLRLFGGTVNLILLTVLCWNLVAERSDALGWAFAGGVFSDLLSAGPMGASVVGLLAVGYVAGLTEGRLYRSNILLPLATALLGTIFFHLIYLAVLTVTGHPINWGDQLAYVTVPSVFLNVIAILPLYWLMRGLHERVRPAKEKL